MPAGILWDRGEQIYMDNSYKSSSSSQQKFMVIFNSPVVVSFSGICLAAMLLDYLTGGWSTVTFFSTYESSWLNPLTYVRLVGHIFGHGSWEHFFSNITILLLIGPMLEEKYGSKFICEFILLTGVVTGLAAALFYTNIHLMGASGIVFAFIMLSSFTSFKGSGIPITFILVAVIYLGGQIISGMTMNDNVSYLTHIVGGCVGSLVGYNFNRKK